MLKEIAKKRKLEKQENLKKKLWQDVSEGESVVSDDDDE
jgi:hypothetical protein